MSAAIFSFARWNPRPRDWTDQELAEFYRVQDALTQAGMSVATDRGLTDEGEPWFVFIRPATDEVIAHFARIDGEFVADASALAEPMQGRDLRHVLNQVVANYDVVVPRRRGGTNLFMHPAAMLTAFVATALMELEGPGSREPGAGDDSRAAVRGEGNASRGAGGPTVTPSNAAGRAVSFGEGGIQVDSAVQSGAVLTAVLAAMSLSADPEPESPAQASGTNTVKLVQAGLDDGDAGRVQAALVAGRRGNPARRDGEAAPESHGDAAEAGADGALASSLALAGNDAEAAVHTEGGPSATLSADLPVDARNHLDVALRLDAPVAAAPAQRTEPEVPEPVATTEPSEERAAEEPRGLPEAEVFRLDLISFEDVAVDLDGLRALFPSFSEDDIADLGGDDGRDGDPGSNADEVEAPGEMETPQPDDGAVGDGDSASDVGPGTPADEAPDRQPVADAPNDAPDVPVDDTPPTTADLVFAGSDSQNATLRGVVDFVLSGQSRAPTVQVDAGSHLGEAASRYAAFNEELPDIVIFDSEAVQLDSFAFMPGVIFVHRDLVETGPIFFENDPHEFNLENGGSVLLIGVADVAAEIA